MRSGCWWRRLWLSAEAWTWCAALLLLREVEPDERSRAEFLRDRPELWLVSTKLAGESGREDKWWVWERTAPKAGTGCSASSEADAARAADPVRQKKARRARASRGLGVFMGSDGGR